MNGNEAADDERPGNVRPGFFFTFARMSGYTVRYGRTKYANA